MRITLYGVRGIMPVTSVEMQKTGGNTSCVLLEIPNKSSIFIFDAGTGIVTLGEKLSKINYSFDIHLFLSNCYWDHLQGLPFFLPAFQTKNTIHIYSPKLSPKPLSEVISILLSDQFQPLKIGNKFKAKIIYHELEEDTFSLNNEIKILTKKLNNPLPCLGYRVEHKNYSFVYTSDHEAYLNQNDEKNREYCKFLLDAQILIADGQYLTDEIDDHLGWGQGSLRDLINNSLISQVKKLIFSHHDPKRTDNQVDSIEKHFRDLLNKKKGKLEISAAREGMVIEL